jgi:polar amino acid transport system substrate-binding protein
MSGVLWWLAALALATASCGEGTPEGGTLERIRARGEIVWGADKQGGEPYVFEDPADPTRLTGFEVDIMDALARRLGVKPRLVQFNWSNLVPSLERGDFDIAINGIEATAERQARILLSHPYFIYAETLAVRTGSKVRSLADLEGKRVAVLNQTYAFDLVRSMPVTPVLYEGVEEPYLDLVSSRVDAVLLDNIVADRYGCKMKGVTCLPDDIARGVYVVGVRKQDPELLAAVNGALDGMRADGELRRILEKWRLWDDRQSEPVPPIQSAPPSAPRTFDWAQAKLFMSAALVTLGLSVAAFLLAVPIGLLLAIGRLYGGAPVRFAARAYIEIFRGTPVLLQLYVIYYGLAPILTLDAFTAAVVGLGLNYAAYESELYRAGLDAVPVGQTEAALALGMSRWQTLRRIVLPQALRVALPGVANDFIALLKDSSLVSVITVVELTKQMTITAVDVRGWLGPGLLCAGLYLALSYPLSRLARRLERRLEPAPA